MVEECMLSTIDNPYNPFEDYVSWMLYDNEHDYNSHGYMMRIAQLTDDMSSVEENMEVERAIDEILEYNPLGIYIKVRKGDKITPQKVEDTDNT